MPIKKEPKKPKENHKTAAWSNVEDVSEISNVAHPNQTQTMEAKEYVEENQK